MIKRALTPICTLCVAVLWGTASLVSAQAPVPPETSTPFVPGDLEKDRRDFVVHLGPFQDDTAGRLEHGGYVAPGASLTGTYYRLPDDDHASARVEVEIVTHPTDYEYVIHDFFGTFTAIEELDRMRRAARPVTTQPAGPDVDAPGIQFLGWVVDGAPAPAVLCRHRSGFVASHGQRFLGWYHVDGNQVTTVLIIYSNLNGLPAKIIDEYLARYPSSTVNNDPASKDWPQKDLAKWIDVLKTKRADRSAMDMADMNLRQRFRRNFALDAARKVMNDPQARNQALDEVVRQVEAFARERAAAASQPVHAPD